MSWPVPSVLGSDLPGGASATPHCAMRGWLSRTPQLELYALTPGGGLGFSPMGHSSHRSSPALARSLLWGVPHQCPSPR